MTAQEGSALQLRGVVVEHLPYGGGPAGRAGLSIVRGEDGIEYACDYTDVASDGFRTLQIGDHVRFVPGEDPKNGAPRATFVLHLEYPSPRELLGISLPEARASKE